MSRWTNHRDTYRAARAALLARAPAAADAAELAKYAFETACACAALDDADGALEALAELAAAGAAAIVRLRFTQGSVTLCWPDGAARTLPPGIFAFGPPFWLNAVYAACVTRDAPARDALCRGDSVALAVESAASTAAAVGTEPYWAPLCGAFAALARGDSGAAELAREADRELAPNPAAPAEVDSNGALKRPLVRLIERLASGETGTWAAEVRAALDEFARFHAPEDRAFFASGRLPLGIVAICALAHERGVSAEQAFSPLLARLVSGAFTRRAYSIEYEFPPAAARSAAEIRWWLDLAGVPRQGRSHALIERGAAVIARYELSGWSTVPKARVELTLDPAGPPLLDPGELLQVSDLHAQAVDLESTGEAPGRRLHLREAVDALDELLARLGPQASSVPAACFTSARGRAVYDKEPGRFERARLEAVRRSYAGLLAGAQAPQQAVDPRAGSLVWISVIKSQLVEFLDRLPGPDGAELVRSLRPRAEDYEKVFTPEAAAAARAKYASWDARVAAPAGTSCAQHIYIAPAGMLREDNELSRYFPGGYRSIAHRLDPHRVWVCWRYARPGERPEMAYDGLAWCDDHWAWFPKPYRALAAQR